MPSANSVFIASTSRLTLIGENWYCPWASLARCTSTGDSPMSVQSPSTSHTFQAPPCSAAGRLCTSW